MGLRPGRARGGERRGWGRENGNGARRQPAGRCLMCGGSDQRLAAPLRSRFGGLPGGEHECMMMKRERGAGDCLS